MKKTPCIKIISLSPDWYEFLRKREASLHLTVPVYHYKDIAIVLLIAWVSF